MLFRFEGIPQKTKSGDNSAEETPVPISNTAVKLRSADDTWREAARESRSLPVLVKKKLHNSVASFFSVSVQNGTAKRGNRLWFPNGGAEAEADALTGKCRYSKKLSEITFILFYDRLTLLYYLLFKKKDYNE